jgi:sugar phosphate isomerase/epimerase
MVKESQVPVGDGKLPIPRIFAQLIKMKYKGCVNLEYEIHDDNPMPGMTKSFAYMRGVLAGIQTAKYSS